MIWHSGLDNWVNPDIALIRYFEDKRYDHIIRTEYLKKDFVNVFTNFGLKEDDKRKILNQKQPLLNKRTYTVEDLSKEQKNQIYKQNPFWYSIQEKVYND